ncbi:MAG: zf-HC2 domain-containing protein [Myxococcales bacterium]
MNERDLEELLPHALAAADAGRCAREAELARYAAGEMDAAERTAFEPHLAACADCRADLAALGPARQAWDDALPVRRAWFRWRPAALVAGLAGAAAALLLLVRPGTEPRLVPKGSWQLLVAVQRGAEVFRAFEGVELREGDRLGFFYTAEQPGYLHILYADEAEAVVLHPTGDKPPQPSPAGTEVRGPGRRGDPRGPWLRVGGRLLHPRAARRRARDRRGTEDGSRSEGLPAGHGRYRGGAGHRSAAMSRWRVQGLVLMAAFAAAPAWAGSSARYALIVGNNVGRAAEVQLEPLQHAEPRGPGAP